MGGSLLGMLHAVSYPVYSYMTVLMLTCLYVDIYDSGN